jgi:hypothetical protein
MALVCCMVPFGQASYQLGIAFIPNKGPAFLVAHVIVFRRCRAILDKALGIFKVAIYCLYSVCDTAFLVFEDWIST